MDAALSLALAPPAESSFYRRLRWLPSVRAVGEHLPAYATHWRDEAEAAVAAARPSLVVLGDSLSQGIGATTPDTSYVGLLRRHLGGEAVPVVNLSRSGARIADVLDTQLPAFEASGVEALAIVCTVGSNDIMHSFRLGRVREQLAALVAALPEGAILATLPESGSRVGSLMNRVIRSEAAAAGRPVADVGRLLGRWRGKVSGDSFHPNDAGYQVWFEAFRPHLGSPGCTTN